MNILRAYAARSEDGRPIRFTASTAGRKKDGLDLRASRVNLDVYRANPVILWAHDHRHPAIGRGDAKLVGEDVVIDVTFDMDDEFAASIDRKVRAGFMSAGSVGIDLTSSPDADGVADWTLTEFSMVPVPLDPDALAQRAAIAAALVDIPTPDLSIDPDFIATAFAVALAT